MTVRTPMAEDFPGHGCGACTALHVCKRVCVTAKVTCLTLKIKHMIVLC